MKSFEQVLNEVGGTGVVGESKTRFIYQELKETFNLKGHTAEIGVYEGRTSKFIHNFCPHKTHYCYDTFSGVALSNPQIDKHKNGDFACGLDVVKSIVGTENVVYKVGIFPNTFTEKNEIFSFVHSDTDTYAGTKATLDLFSIRVIKHGKIFFDDYKWEACPGVEKAVHEFLNRNKNFNFVTFPHQCVLTKIN